LDGTSSPQAVINGFFLAGAARSPSRARSGSYLASGSALCDRIFREDLLDPFERLSAAACGVSPSFMIATHALGKTRSFWTCSPVSSVTPKFLLKEIWKPLRYK